MRFCAFTSVGALFLSNFRRLFNLTVDSEYGTIDKNRVTLAIGDYYTLPIPSSLKAGESFQGWYNGNEKVTDAQGKSFEKCTWNSTVTLTAAYYVEISTIYEFMDLAGKDLVGKYIITQDLDFKGLGVNWINSLTGTFDGGGHTLKNFTLSTGASYSTYSGLFRTVYANSTVCNMIFENVNCSEQYASGIVGVLYSYQSVVNNIEINNSFHNSIRSVLIGAIHKRSLYENGVDVAQIQNIKILNSGEKSETYGIYKANDSSNYKPSISINGFYIDGNSNVLSDACGLFKYEGSSEEITVSNYILKVDIDYGVSGRLSSHEKFYVKNSEIHSKTKIAWSGVSLIKDSIHTGTTQSWGAKESIRCIDAGSEIGSYDLGEISSSIILYPDANGVFTYYSASGTMATFNDVSLIDKDLFISMLGFDSTVWDLDNIDIENGIYPTIRK